MAVCKDPRGRRPTRLLSFILITRPFLRSEQRNLIYSSSLTLQFAIKIGGLFDNVSIVAYV